ncbi:MAG: glycosyltransferase family 2 protein [Bacteroidota bacterium]|nr:glycosyltransferase family 2 protein [Bacteroidota bacterium]
MNFKPDISVILPYYNAEKTLERSIQSVLKQSHSNFELIAVNNNSTDKSELLVKKLAATDHRIKRFSEPKQGVAHASRTGLKNAQGKYIARTDADDICKADRLEKQLDFLENNPKYGVVGSRVEYAGPSENEGMISFINRTNKNITHEELSLNRFSELQLINPTLMFRKEIADRLGYYEQGDFPEDFELFLRWMENDIKFYKLPQPLLIWQDSETRLTRTDSRYSFDAFYKTKTPYIVNYLKKVNPHFPEVVIWGAGRRSRRRANLLKAFGIKIKFYIDIVKTKDYAVYYEKIKAPGDYFILSYVGKRGADEIITDYLEARNFIKGKDFLIVA